MDMAFYLKILLVIVTFGICFLFKEENKKSK